MKNFLPYILLTTISIFSLVRCARNEKLGTIKNSTASSNSTVTNSPFDDSTIPPVGTSSSTVAAAPAELYLSTFSAVTGTLASGDISLSWEYTSPPTVSYAVSIRRQPGSIPPSATCLDGTEINLIYATSGIKTFVDHTGSINGGSYSYRICVYKNGTTISSTLSAANVQALDLTSASPLPAFLASTGTGNGQINLNLTYPSDTSDYGRVEIRRKAGTAAPNSSCQDSSDQIAFSQTIPFSSGTLVDNTGSSQGEPYSYRVCIFDRGLRNITSSNVAAAIASKDGTPPPALTTFSGIPGVSEGQVYISIGYPSNLSDYQRVSVLRQAGNTPPECNSGVTVRNLVKSIENPNPFSNESFTETLSTVGGATYSYRACIWDAQNNLTSSNTIVGLAPYHAPSASVDIKVNGVESASVAYEGSVTLSWTSTNATSCTVTGPNLSSTQTSNPGLVAANLTQTSTFSISCNAPGGSATDSVVVTVGNPTDHLMFVSSSIHTGNLGGLAGADQICTDLAVAAGLRPERSWVALLSTSSPYVNAKDHVRLNYSAIYNTRPAALGGRQKVADSSNFWNNSWLANPRYDEAGNVGIITDNGKSKVWTGTEDNGYMVGINCRQWTSTSRNDLGLNGLSDGNTYGDRYNVGTEACDQLLHIYCISQ